jgi:peptidoglycan glycosyltransferase
MKNKIIKVILGVSFLLLMIVLLKGNKTGEDKKVVSYSNNEKELFLNVKSSLDKSFYLDETWNESVKYKDENFKLSYSFDSKLTTYVKKLIKKHYSYITSIVIIDNDTGEILTAVDYNKKLKKYGKALTFSSTNPAASLFKVITASALMEKSKVKPKTNFLYRGKSTTLYKYQLKSKKTRWTRKISFEKAFSYSNNVVFGKAAINHLTSKNLYQMAENFGFNENLLDEISFSTSQLKMPKSQYNLAEVACGFNRTTMISPIHAAVMSSIIANKGVLKKHHFLKDIKNQKNEKVWSFQGTNKRILSVDSAQKVSQMMELTVKRGTARRVFRTMKRRIRKKLIIGGKTGTITGGLPVGKRDWFTVYAKPKDKQSGGISVAVMIVNLNKWYVKSTFLAKKIIEYYYQDQRTLITKSNTEK